MRFSKRRIDMAKKKLPQCARCPIARGERICEVPGGKAPAFCPTRAFEALKEEVLQDYLSPELHNFVLMASVQEAECYANRGLPNYVLQPIKTRVEETAEFARRIGARRIGIAFCVGVQREAALLSEVFERQGFEVVSVCCKVGGISKEAIGIKDEQKVRVGTYESMCNPFLQAEVLNRSGTELNVLLGLCVGHDALFLKRAKAFCTVLATKDRVLGHNPLAALYTLHSYYRKLRVGP